MRKLTQGLLAFAVTSLAGYDAWVYRNYGTESTISAVCRDFFTEWPIAAVAVGCVVGHICWPLNRKAPTES